MKKYFIILLLLVTFAGACQQSSAPDAETKAILEKETRAYWQQVNGKDIVSGFSIHKISDDIYVIATTFSDGKQDIPNVIARRFEANGKTTWKVEPYEGEIKNLIKINKP